MFAEAFGQELVIPQAEGFGEVKCAEETGRVYQGIFIAGAELDYLRRQGPDAFEAAFRKQDAELCSVRRAPCV